MEQNVSITELRAYRLPDGSVVVRVVNADEPSPAIGSCLGYLRLSWSKLIARVFPRKFRGVQRILFAALRIWNSPGLRDNPRAVRGRINMLVYKDGQLYGEQELPARNLRPIVRGQSNEAVARGLIRRAYQEELGRYLHQ